MPPGTYRGRLAPSPTGYLHQGHVQTFWLAQERARAHHGVLVLRDEDLDGSRARAEFATAMIEDLRWFGFDWQEGPDCGGAYGPYQQSQRLPGYRIVFEQLKAKGAIYPCSCTRKDVQQALQAPHIGQEEPPYPGTCRPGRRGDGNLKPGGRINWRFQVPDGATVGFVDGHYRAQSFVAGKDFGDFVVWRSDGLPSYQLAVVVDDHEMAITEVVRGADLLLSTARQLLIYHALGWEPPAFYHCPLVLDAQGNRLAKRHDALSLRTLRQRGESPENIRRSFPPTGS
ncbi:MAG: tRNA glutamyl-Q(34) synthetase GluQRS [Verrucomicrobiota bacterium]